MLHITVTSPTTLSEMKNGYVKSWKKPMLMYGLDLQLIVECHVSS